MNYEWCVYKEKSYQYTEAYGQAELIALDGSGIDPDDGWVRTDKLEWRKLVPLDQIVRIPAYMKDRPHLAKKREE